MKHYTKILLCIGLVGIGLMFSDLIFASETKEIINETKEIINEVGLIVGESKETTEFVFDKMEQYFDAAGKIIEKYGGDVTTLGLNALRISAASIIIFPLVVFIISSIVPLIFGKRVTTWAIGYDRENQNSSEAPAILVPIFSGAFLLIAWTVSLGHLINIWAWVGIFYPELYAVHKFILS